MHPFVRLCAAVGVALACVFAPVAPSYATSAPAVQRAGGVTVTKAPGTVRRGATASVAIKTTAKASCSISVRYKSGPSKAQGLGTKQADANGKISWAWKVGTRTTSGSWPVVITCGASTARTAVVVP